MTPTYHAYLEQILELYCAEQYEQALAYLETYRDAVNGIDAQIDNFTFCISAVMGDRARAFAIFEKAIQEKGHWYETAQLESDSDLDILRDDVKFKALLEMNRRREHEFLGLGKPVVHIREGHLEKGYILIHGNHENARVTKGAWTEEVVDGALTAFLQSGQPDFHDAYHWNDRHKAREDAKLLINQVKTSYPDVKCWVLVGFSMGASVALDVLKDTDLSLEHVILFGPWLPHLDAQKPHFETMDIRCRWSIFIGDKDEDCDEHAVELRNILADYGIEAEYIVMENTGHGFPSTLKAYMKQLEK